MDDFKPVLISAPPPEDPPEITLIALENGGWKLLIGDLELPVLGEPAPEIRWSPDCGSVVTVSLFGKLKTRAPE